MKKRSSYYPKILFISLVIISTVTIFCLNLIFTSSSSNLVICAAASLQPAMTEIKTIYEQQNPDTVLTYNFGASGLLQQQIKRGVSADIFFSASSQEMDKLANNNLIIKHSRRNILQNKIALVTLNRHQNINLISDMTTNKINKVVIGDFKIVPIGKYTKEVLQNYQIWDDISDKLVFAQDEQTVLTYIKLGYGEVGFVYLSSAKTNDRVKIISVISSQYHQPINYPIAIVKNSSHIQKSQKLINFLMSDLAKQIFNKYNFEN